MQTVTQQLPPNPWFTGLAIAVGIVVVILTGGFALLVIYKAAKNQINLTRLISEPNGDASISRLQLLIFTFVIALSLFLIILGKTPPGFPESIPADLLTLLGISSTSYLVSKGIQFSNPAGLTAPRMAIHPVNPPNGTVASGPAGATASFAAAPATATAAGGSSLPAVSWSLDSPSHGSLSPTGNTVVYTSDPNQPAGMKITLRAKAAGFEDATADIMYV
jgi:hypothetical protein